MPKLSKVRQEILNDLKARALDLYKELGNLRAVGEAIGKSHTWVKKVVDLAVDNSKLPKEL